MKRFTHCPARGWILITGAVLGFAWAGYAQQTKPLYQNNFEQAALDKLPDDIQVLEGTFEVKQEDGNKFLLLPVQPLDTFGFQFGPAQKDEVIASARVYGTSKGRRFPTFSLGLNGVGGYRLQVSPAKNLLELFHYDQAQTNAPFEWISGQWTHLAIAVRKTGDGWTIQGKAWMEAKPEPGSWTISAAEKKELPNGRAVLFANPFSGTPLRFDDLEVRAAK